jgi:hypothetical protein
MATTEAELDAEIERRRRALTPGLRATGVLEALVRDLYAELSEMVDINDAGGPNFAGRMVVEIEEACRKAGVTL